MTVKCVVCGKKFTCEFEKTYTHDEFACWCHKHVHKAEIESNTEKICMDVKRKPEVVCLN